MIPVPYKVRGNHQIPIPYKVLGTIRVIDSYKVPTFHIRYWGTIRVIDSYIPYKVWGTIRVIDSYKVPMMDSNHIVHVGENVCPCPQGLGALICLKNGKYLICIVLFRRFFMASKALYNCKYHPTLGHSLCQFLCEEEPPTPWGVYRSPRLPYHGYPIGAVILFRMHIFFHLPSLQGTNFTPW